MIATSFVKTALGIGGLGIGGLGIGGLGIGALGLAALATPALAQDTADGPGSTVSVAVTAGTLGIGPDVRFRISDHFAIRGNAAFFGFSHTQDIDGNDYTVDLKLKSFGAMADLYPFGGAFRISGGARINRNRAGLSGDFRNDTRTVEIDGVKYSGRDVGILSGRARVKKFAPALTIGLAGGNSKGFFFSTDIGVLFQGSVKIDEFTSTGGTLSTAQTPAGDTFRERLRLERVNVQNDVNDYKLYPIIQSGIGWRF